ncbi:Recombination and DNA strand exchange inhibitor protein MutS [Helicobacter trogontum]|uniref:Recombination and DNA strand exchange inhibitor protein MutS n=1 Tax=Helicobacter trogontum TaxID=50960 RepID=A0ABQ0D573_9HELI
MSKRKKQPTQKFKPFTKAATQALQDTADSSALTHVKQTLIKLGLQDFLQSFSTYFARQIEVGHTIMHEHHTFFMHDKMLSHILHIPSHEKLKALIEALDTYNNIGTLQLPKVRLLNNEILSLAKGGTLRLYDIFQCLQMVKFFYDYAKKDDIDNKYLKEYMQKFVFPSDITALLTLFIFDSKDNAITPHALKYLSQHADSELFALYKALDKKHKEKQEALYNTLHISTLQEYLVDKQIHFFEDNATLLVRAGYANALHARVVGRSMHGFFYIVPSSLEHIESHIHILHDKVEERLLYLAKEYSKILSKHIHFLRFVHTEYDFMDRALARLHFARDFNYSFVFAENKQNTSIILHEYAHPSLKNPIPINVAMPTNLLMITGVNAGGKTMLLKSILSALWCAKLYIPMRINAHKSQIPYIKNIHIIAQDPQDSHNDISTFSGRIQEISTLLMQKDMILGIDEIEIGTDSSEAASLYKVILESFLENNVKIIVTTHHKHLAALMADNTHTKLLAALYDYKRACPTFSFAEGIGKSYAMECAKQYGIPQEIINEAKKVHGDEANKLERLIEESHTQITKNRQDSLKLQALIKEQDSKIQELENAKKQLKVNFEEQSLALKRHYNEAIKEIKMLAKQSSGNLKVLQNLKELDNHALQGTQEIVKNIHKLLNKAHKNEAKSPRIHIESVQKYNINDMVQYQNKQAKIIAQNKDSYTIELQNGVRLKGVQGVALKPMSAIQVKQQVTLGYKLEAEIRATTRLDLHGYTREEAQMLLEDFINQAIMAKFSEVLIVHGMGNGILKRMVESFLDSCNYIRGYVQAPPNMGGLGAKIVYL